MKTAADVDAALAQPGTTMVMVNSICGCAAGGARSGVTKALQNTVIPDQLTTVFAGVDMEVTARARELMPNVRPSSPSVAIFKDCAPVYVLERRRIERMRAEEIATELVRAFKMRLARTRDLPCLPRFTTRWSMRACAGRRFRRFEGKASGNWC
jgi:putative YphP/YqiW family bacilliredoxin